MDEGTTNLDSKITISSVPNLRVICSRLNLEGVPGVYRSSKPDRIIPEELKKFRNLGIKCIVDFRSMSEYMGRDGDHLLDEEYPLHKVRIKKTKNGFTQFYSEKVKKIIEDSKSKQKSKKENENEEGAGDDGNGLLNKENPSTEMRNRFDATKPLLEANEKEMEYENKHFLIDFYPFKYVLSMIFFNLPWYMMLRAFFVMFADLIRRNKFKNFINFFIQEAVNKRGIKAQYIDMITYCQPQICSGN